MSRPEEAARALQALIGRSDRERFAALYLNNRHQITHAHIVSVGSATTAQVHPREVFKAGVLANAAAVIVGHNHPSGDVTPSVDDKRVAERLRAAGEVLGITVLDALIVGPAGCYYCETRGQVLALETHVGAPGVGSGEFEARLQRLAETARFILGGTAGDLLGKSAEELAQQVVDLVGGGGHALAAERCGARERDLKVACRKLLEDIDEVLERTGEAWWGETVTSGRHHRTAAERLIGREPYQPVPDADEPPTAG